MKHKLQFINETKKIFKYQNLLKILFLDVIKFIDLRYPTFASVIIIEKSEMLRLCMTYQKKNKITDVLSFAQDWEENSKLIHTNILGDIFICRAKVEEQAKSYNHSIKREISYLFVHGLLHLLGYDHHNEKTEDKMNQLTNRFLKKYDISRKKIG